jgi:putative hydrolase of the HAD superfamily
VAVPTGPAVPPSRAKAPLAAVFLDAGGTLLCERTSRAALYAEVAREAGLDVGEREMRAWMYRIHAALPRRVGTHFRYSRGWFEAYIEALFADGLGLARERLAGVQATLFERFADARNFTLLPNAGELVEGLARRGLCVAVVSNWSEALPGLLAGLGLARHLRFSVVSALEGCEKPEPEIFARALARAGVRPSAALHAGNDVERDVRGARAAGILPVLVDRATPTDEPCARVDDLFALERLILELCP